MLYKCDAIHMYYTGNFLARQKLAPWWHNEALQPGLYTNKLRQLWRSWTVVICALLLSIHHLITTNLNIFASGCFYLNFRDKLYVKDISFFSYVSYIFLSKKCYKNTNTTQYVYLTAFIYFRANIKCFRTFTLGISIRYEIKGYSIM